MHITSALAAAALLTAHASAVTPGFRESFLLAGNTGGFTGGSSAGTLYTNPGSGGVGGANDGYLNIANERLGFLGGYNAFPEFAGNWTEATGVSFWLNDFGTFNNVEVHVGFGRAVENFWMYNPGFRPVSNTWTQFSIDLTNIVQSQWTRIRGTGTLMDALTNSDRILFRHDLVPITSSPNPIIGDFAIDEIVILPAPGAVALLAPGILAFGGRRRK